MTTSPSEKDDKRHANRLCRRRLRAALRTDAEVLPTLREVSNVWKFDKDGKRRFDATAFPELLRK
jgi:hypothetical protein